MLKGITVTLYEKEQIGTDGFNSPIYKETPVQVDNVLVSPSFNDEMVSSNDLYGKKTVFTLAIPKGDTHEWKDRKVEFVLDKKYTMRTFGTPVVGIESMVPLYWHKKVMCEMYE